jgi:Arc/MetJ-type ribon-helix-helix transcriptional regulator
MANTKTMDPMEKITVHVPKILMVHLEAVVNTGLYPNTSEAVRVAIRHLLDDSEIYITKFETITSKIIDKKTKTLEV